MKRRGAASDNGPRHDQQGDADDRQRNQPMSAKPARPKRLPIPQPAGTTGTVREISALDALEKILRIGPERLVEVAGLERAAKIEKAARTFMLGWSNAVHSWDAGSYGARDRTEVTPNFKETPVRNTR